MSIAALSQPLPPAAFTEFRMLPAGVFRAADGSGRPAGVPGWSINGAIAQRIIAGRAGRDDLVIDYEHQTIAAAANGQPAPAAGWIGRLEWREGDGLHAAGVRWTNRAAAMIAAREYRFISPVFTFDGKTGEVGDIQSAGLTNNPGLAGLTDLALLTGTSPAEALRDSDRSIRVFNETFGASGIFHPDTPAAELKARQAQLRGEAPRQPSLAGVAPDDADKLRRLFPGVFGG